MGVYKKLDIWSINDSLDTIIDFEMSGNTKDSQYFDYYSDQINEMSILASDMWNELNRLKEKLGYELPYKNVEFYAEDECQQNGIAWFNTAATMLSDTDMTALLENEEIYCSDEAKEKQKRINAFEKLTKKLQVFLFTEVIGFITRYLELQAAFDTITSTINELDYHQSFIQSKNGELQISEIAFL